MSDIVRVKKLLKAMVSHPTTAFRREGNKEDYYPIRSWWWDKARTDSLLAEAQSCLASVTDDSLVDQILWNRASLFWFLGRFDEAEADLVRLNRSNSVYKQEIGQVLGLVRKRRFPHEVF